MTNCPKCGKEISVENLLQRFVHDQQNYTLIKSKISQWKEEGYDVKELEEILEKK